MMRRLVPRPSLGVHSIGIPQANGADKDFQPNQTRKGSGNPSCPAGLAAFPGRTARVEPENSILSVQAGVGLAPGL